MTTTDRLIIVAGALLISALYLGSIYPAVTHR
jgi:hypothetical protein